MMYHTRTANWCYKNGNLWDLRAYYGPKNQKSQIFIEKTPQSKNKSDHKGRLNFGAGEGNPHV